MAIPDGRPLGVGERLFFHVDRACPPNTVVVGMIDGPLTQEIIRRALDAAQARHPLTRARLSWKGTPAFVLDAPPIELRIADGPEAQWIPLAERGLAEPLPIDRGPFVRATWLSHGAESSTLILNVHHGICDARSLLLFFRDVVRAVGRLAEGRDPGLEPLPLSPPLDSLLPAWVYGAGGVRRAASALASEALGLLKSGLPRRMPTEAESTLAQRRTRIIVRTLTADATATLVHAARANGTTMQGILSAAVFLAMRDELAPGGDIRLTNFFPVDLRKRLDPPIGEDLGLFVSAIRATHHVRPETRAWPFAREVRQLIEEQLTRQDPLVLPFAVSRALGALTRPLPVNAWGSRQVARLFGAVPVATTGVTNLGVADLPERVGALRLRSTFLAAALFTMGQFVTCAATVNGRLHFCFLYLEPTVSRGRAERLADGFLRHLDAALAEALPDTSKRAVP